MSQDAALSAQRPWLPYLALFASLSTLICCALPALLVSVGLGAVVAGLVTAAPQIVWLSAHKGWVFAGAGALLALSGAWLWQARSLPCPADPQLAKACADARRVSVIVWGVSVALFAVGAFFAFFAAALLA